MVMLVEVQKLNKEEVTVVSSLDVAETFEKRHADVLQKIEELIKTENSVVTMFYETTYKSGTGKNYKMYYMNRDGFTLLVMGFTGQKAMQFKLAYIKQFNAMEKQLKEKLVERQKGIAVRQALTKSIQQSNENERMHGHAYSTYTNCIYKVIFGKNAKQLREEYGIDKKANPRDYFSSEELKAVQSMECLVSGLVDCGWDYNRIKDFIQQTNTKLLMG
nr:MAG TPA: regulatory protein [Caudoviricetes sp.]